MIKSRLAAFPRGTPCMQDVTQGGRKFFVGSCKRLFRKGGAINFSQSLFATSIIATSENIFCNSLRYPGVRTSITRQIILSNQKLWRNKSVRHSQLLMKYLRRCSTTTAIISLLLHHQPPSEPFLSSAPGAIGAKIGAKPCANFWRKVHF
jgi:hypothetical protein